jgi:outer membrane protein assembly factor BamB
MMINSTLSLSLLLAATAGAQAPDRAALEAAFEKQMSGCRMVGRFTVHGSDRAPQEDSYTIAKVSKVGDDKWRFEAKIEYGGKSVTVPLVVGVLWAGDTPMIQVTDLGVPVLGTYSARVLVYGDQYAGVWSGVDHGGQMFGRIERAATKAAPQDPAAPPKKKAGEPPQDRAVTWSNWRGPSGTGAAPGKPPTEWSEERNVRWKTPLPGLGSSSPVAWGDRVYVTTAVETDEQGAAPTQPAEPPREGGRRGGRRGGFGGGGAPLTTLHEFAVLAIDRADGKVVWQTTVAKTVPHERGHATGSQASNSPLTDGQRIYAFFGSRGLHCLDMDGKVQWSKEFGQMRTRNGFGEGASPALHQGRLIVNWDHEGDSFITALDASSGKELWRTARDEQTTWGTPIVVPVDGRDQVIITGTGASRGYDFETGKEIWRCGGMTANCIPTPIHDDGVVYLMSGFRGNALQAIKLAGAKGDITDSAHVLWSYNRNTSYVPSALLYGDFLYFLRTNSGVLTCLDAETGEVQYEGQRLGIREVYSSPVGADGRVYVTSRDGITKVVRLGTEYEELATNQLDDGFDATAAIVGDEIYLRGRKSLYCIAER